MPVSNGEMPAMVYMSQNAMWDTGFVFTNHEGHSTFSFRIPSEEEIVLK